MAEVKVKVDTLNPKGDSNQDSEFRNQVLAELRKIVLGLSDSKSSGSGSKDDKEEKKKLEEKKKKLEEVDDVADRVSVKGKDVVKTVGKVYDRFKDAITKITKFYGQFVESSAKALQTASTKFISAGSLKTDSAVADMMQKTGQSSSEAQATLRALERLDLTFEDLQSGKLTEAQAKAFEELRDHETGKLEAMEEAGSGIFERIQGLEVSADTLMSDLMDGFLMMLLESGDSLNAVMDVVDVVMGVVEELIPMIMQILQPLIDRLPMILEALMPLLDMLGNLLEFLVPILTVLIDEILGAVVELLEALMPVIQALLEMLMPIIEIIADLVVGLLPPLVAILKVLFKVLEPIINVMTGIVKVIQNTFGWLMKLFGLKDKADEAYKSVDYDDDPFADSLRRTEPSAVNTQNNNVTTNYNYGGSNPSSSSTSVSNSTAIKINIGGLGT